MIICGLAGLCILAGLRAQEPHAGASARNPARAGSSPDTHIIDCLYIEYISIAYICQAKKNILCNMHEKQKEKPTYFTKMRITLAEPCKIGVYSAY